jgi:hypothetical protein
MIVRLSFRFQACTFSVGSKLLFFIDGPTYPGTATSGCQLPIFLAHCAIFVVVTEWIVGFV